MYKLIKLIIIGIIFTIILSHLKIGLIPLAIIGVVCGWLISDYVYPKKKKG